MLTVQLAAAVLLATDDTDTLRVRLAEHEPVLGVFGGRAGIVGCSCLSARDYRAAGQKAGLAGWLDHLAAALGASAPEGGGVPSDPRGNVPPQFLGGGHRMHPGASATADGEGAS
jgi:hypothetical protein